MVKFLKAGKITLPKVVIVLQGKYAGKKAVIVKSFDEGTKAHAFGHCLVAGLAREPLRVTSKMGAKRVAKRSRVKPFIKLVNHNHMLPTRYNLDADLKGVVSAESLKDPAARATTKKAIKGVFQEKYNSGKNKWFFSKLKF